MTLAGAGALNPNKPTTTLDTGVRWGVGGDFMGSYALQSHVL